MMHSDFSLSIRSLGGFHAAYTGMYHRVACVDKGDIIP